MLFLLPVLTGILLTLSFPRSDLGWLAWPAYAPLVVFVFRAGSPAKAFSGGFVAGAIQYFVLLIWMPEVLISYGGLPAVLAWLGYTLLIAVLACYPAAASLLSGFLIKRCGPTFILAFPAIWICMEYLQTVSPFGGLPWLLAGYTQFRFIRLIQIADITGVYGISFLILSFGTAVAWIIVNRGRNLRAYVPLALACAFAVGALSYGGAALERWSAGEPQYRVAMLQGNISFDDPEALLMDKVHTGYVRMADGLDSSVTDLLILPEAPTPLSYDADSGYRRTLQDLARRFRFGLVFNNIRESGSGGTRLFYNSAYFLDGKGMLQGVYDKIHLVPFGEYIPLRKLLFFIDIISKDVGEFAAGRNYALIETAGRPVSAVICFEAVFPQLVREFVRQGSQLIVNITNDRWYGDSDAPFQHLAIVRMRAIENRRYLLRAANSGISAVVEPSGRITSSTGILQEAVCQGSFDFQTYRTLYTRYGDFFVFLCAIISCGLSVFAMRKCSKDAADSGGMNARRTS